MSLRRTPIADFSKYFDGPPLTPGVVAKLEHEGGPLAQHRNMVAAEIFPPGSPHIHEHGTLSAAMEMMPTIDQLDINQLISAELIVRRRELLGEVYTTAKLKKAKPDWSIADHFLGCVVLRNAYALTDIDFKKYLAESLRGDVLIARELRDATDKKD